MLPVKIHLYPSILMCFFLFKLIPAHAQGENDNWIFGSGCRLSFQKGFPEILPSIAEFRTQEGCTTVSDASGNLLFYSDGITVWDRYHVVMDKGRGLLGDPSSTTSCVIVPQPGHPGLYFIFCVDANTGGNHYKLTYNIVDIRMNAGRGSVVVKNAHIISPCDEKIAITRHCNAKDFWIVTHLAKSNMFAAYKLDNKGLSSSPVFSSTQHSYSFIAEIGYLKFSPDGQFLASANGHNHVLEILRFDKRNGHIYDWAYDKEKAIYGQCFYGVAFSADGRMLYASQLDAGKVFQYDLSLGRNEITGQRKLIMQLMNRAGGMQLASDNRIYISDGYSSPYLHRINMPELIGLECEPELKALKFDRGTQLGLPSLVESVDKYFELGQDSVINLDEHTLTANIHFASYFWSTGDTTQSITIYSGGVYWVKVYDRENCLLITDTIRIHLLKEKRFILSNEFDTLHVCSGDSVKIPEPVTDREGVVFKWKNSFPLPELPDSGEGNIPVFSTPKTDTILSFQLELTPFYRNAEGAKVHYTVYIRPTPDIKPKDKVLVCGGNRLPDNLVELSPTLSLVSWTNNNVTSGIPESGTLTDLLQIKIRPIASDTTCVLRFTATLDGCHSKEMTAKIVCLATPVLENPKPVKICQNETIPAYRWQYSHDGTIIHWNTDAPGLYYADSGTGDLPACLLKGEPVSYKMQIHAYPVRFGCRGQHVIRQIEFFPGVDAGISVHPEPVNGQPAEKSIILKAMDTTAVFSSWTADNGYYAEGDSCFMTYQVNLPFSITHLAQNTFGCQDTSIWRYTPLFNTAFIPNALHPFSLHGNNTFGITGPFDVLECSIFNRWGQLIFKCHDGSSWDGRYEGGICPAGVYVYKFLLADQAGVKHEMKGTVHLIY